MAVTDVWADWSTTAASNSPAGAATPEVDDELRNIKAQCKGNVPIVATQAQQETGTATTAWVAPGVQKYHPSACKAWGKFGVTGNLIGGYNITSISDDATGQATATFTVAFSTNSYSLVATACSDSALFVHNSYVTGAGQGVSTCQLYCRDAGGSLTDPVVYYIATFGDQ